MAKKSGGSGKPKYGSAAPTYSKGYVQRQSRGTSAAQHLINAALAAKKSRMATKSRKPKY
jgi:hypothetical protein